MGILSDSKAAESVPVTAAHTAAKATLITRIQPSRGWGDVRLGEVWSYRELLFFLMWRDLKVKYKQTVLGASWAVIQPFVTMIVFTFVFGRLARLSSDGLPYPLFYYAALVPWTLFSGALGAAANSLVGSSNLIKKIYFPRLIIPVASAAATLIEFGLSLLILFAMMVFYGFTPSIHALWLIPALTLLSFVTAVGFGLWLSAMNVRFRDIRYIVPFLTQIWLFLTPVIYPTSSIEDPTVRALFSLNPMAGVVEGFRWALLGSGEPPNQAVIVSAVAAVVILITGVIFFRRMERTFADVV